jgi:hypothetical protein
MEVFLIGMGVASLIALLNWAYWLGRYHQARQCLDHYDRNYVEAGEEGSYEERRALINRARSRQGLKPL